MEVPVIRVLRFYSSETEIGNSSVKPPQYHHTSVFSSQLICAPHQCRQVCTSLSEQRFLLPTLLSASLSGLLLSTTASQGCLRPWGYGRVISGSLTHGCSCSHSPRVAQFKPQILSQEVTEPLPSESYRVTKWISSHFLTIHQTTTVAPEFPTAVEIHEHPCTCSETTLPVLPNRGCLLCLLMGFSFLHSPAREPNGYNCVLQWVGGEHRWSIRAAFLEVLRNWD